MDGVTVLTEATQIGGLDIATSVFIGILIFLLLSVAFLLVLVLLDVEQLLPTVVIPVVSCIVFISVVSTLSIHTHKIKEKSSIKITIDDSVSFNDINDKYEIIEQEGKIFTVIEKTQENNE